MRFVLLAALILVASPAWADRYEFDKEHTNIMFYVNHVGFSDMMGVFTAYDGYFKFDPKHPEKSKVEVTLHPDSIRTSSKALDKELQSEHFFNATVYPTIHFVSNAVTVTGENTGDVTGELTMLNITKPITLRVHFNKADYHPITKFYIAGFKAEATLNRSDFGMDYLISMVGNEVRLEIQTEGINIDRKNAERIKH